MSFLASTCRTAALALLVLSTSCEPRRIEIQGLDELTSEIRSQRLLNRRSAAAGKPAAGETIPGEQIRAAMSPLRDVLTQLAASQKDLSGRQATLTQEMRRWTQLLVESMQANRADEANQLSQRLANLEKTIAEQDARHRQVEELLGTALDRTADQLEDFLKRLGASNLEANPNTSGAPTEAGNATGTGGTIPTPPPGSGGGDPAAGTPPSQPTSTGGTTGATRPGGEEQQASMRWLWWTLAFLSVVSGLAVLRGRRRPQPVAMAPEMQFAPEPAAEEFAPTQSTPAAQPTPHNGDEDPEVEELWAAAALLGEAIGRLKQSGDATPVELGGSDRLPEAPEFDLPASPRHNSEPAGHERHLDDRDLDEMFVIDEDEPEVSGAGQADDATLTVASDVIQSLGLPDALTEPGPKPDGILAPLAAPEPSHAADVAVATPEPISQPATRNASQAPIRCRLHLPADQQTERRVRRLLGSDPRVLVTPPPQILTAMGELEVSFALLPGLPAGERSLLEQQLRDTVA